MYTALFMIVVALSPFEMAERQQVGIAPPTPYEFLPLTVSPTDGAPGSLSGCKAFAQLKAAEFLAVPHVTDARWECVRRA